MGVSPTAVHSGSPCLAISQGLLPEAFSVLPKRLDCSIPQVPWRTDGDGQWNGRWTRIRTLDEDALTNPTRGRSEAVER